MTAERIIPLNKRIRYALETAAAYTFYGLFRLLPLDAASNAGGWILRTLGPRMGVSRTALRNIARAFPEKTEAQQHKILLDMWDNLGRVIGEYPHLHRVASRVELIGGEHLDAVRESGQATLFFAGHIGNWEVNPVVARQKGVDITLVYRRPNNPWVDGLLRHARNAGGTGYIAKGRRGGREILATLKGGGTVGILMDQKMNEGLPVPFFGRDAMTAPAVAHFALGLGCPLYSTRVERLGGARFRVTIYPPLKIEDTGDKDADVLRILGQINGRLESWIRERPGQWLWIHRRWPE